MEAIAKLTACLESIAEKIRYMDQVSKQRIGQIEQDLRAMKTEMDLLRHTKINEGRIVQIEQDYRGLRGDMETREQKCIAQMAKCPIEKVSRFEWLIFGTCVTTMGALVVALVVAYMQVRQAFPPAG